MIAAAPPLVFVQVLFYNSLTQHGPAALIASLQALADQEGFQIGANLQGRLVDNASSDGTWDFVKSAAPPGLERRANQANLGFAGAYNQGAAAFLASAAEYFLLLNPDAALSRTALGHLVAALERQPAAGSATPRLLRADEQLQPLDPPVLDAAGMIFTRQLRHLDRGSGEMAAGRYLDEELVFGGSGACLLLRRALVVAALSNGGDWEEDSTLVCPALAAETAERALLFDEAFFAYREDADLAWRSQILGWRCVYAPQAVVYHRRVVTPERRAMLPAELNLMGVRNRFLLQLNNLPPWPSIRVLLSGVLWRNLVVILGVLWWERSSRPALWQVWRLRRRALRRRSRLYERARAEKRELRDCFTVTTHPLRKGAVFLRKQRGLRFGKGSSYKSKLQKNRGLYKIC